MSEINNELQQSIEPVEAVKRKVGRPKKEKIDEPIVKPIRNRVYSQDYFKKYYLEKTKIKNEAQEFYCDVCDITIRMCSKRNHLVTDRIHALKCKLKEIATS